MYKKIAALFTLMALFLLSCQDAAYLDLGKKAVEVDSLIIKARAAGLSNMDSLRAARRDKALSYIAGVNPERVRAENYHAAARLFFAAGKADSARLLLEKYAPAGSDREALDLLFSLYLQKGDPVKAEQLFRDKLANLAGEEAGEYYLNLLYGYQEQDQLDKAIAVADAGIAALPPETKGSLVVEKADMLHQKGDRTAALALLDDLKKSIGAEDRLQRAIAAKTTLFNLIGAPAKEWRAAGWIDSGPMLLKDLRGKVILLDFWAPWCGPCRAMFPHLKKLYGEYHDQGLVIIGLTRCYGRFNQLGQNLRDLAPATELEWITKFKEHHQIPFPYAVADAEEAAANEAAYGVYGIPHMVVIDKKGVVQEYAIGSGPSSEKKLDDAIARLIAE
ncbi:MAG TPA: redoxin family protein [bacterium]|nr:redoxin family protein [bacterium]